jgi:hypothetical protein
MKMPSRPDLVSTLVATAFAALSTLAPTDATADTQRSPGAQDTSRAAPNRNKLSGVDTRTRTDYGYRDYDPYRHYGADPATRRFWSPQCVQQRQSGLSPLNHTRDCDNPAYTGAYPPYSRRYPHPYAPRDDRFGVTARPGSSHGPRRGRPYQPLQPPSSIRPWSGYSGR